MFFLQNSQIYKVVKISLQNSPMGFLLNKNNQSLNLRLISAVESIYVRKSCGLQHERIMTFNSCLLDLQISSAEIAIINLKCFGKLDFSKMFWSLDQCWAVLYFYEEIINYNGSGSTHKCNKESSILNIFVLGFLFWF